MDSATEGFATDERNTPEKFIIADKKQAFFIVNALVPTHVAIALAASVNPFIKMTDIIEIIAIRFRSDNPFQNKLCDLYRRYAKKSAAD